MLEKDKEIQEEQISDDDDSNVAPQAMQHTVGSSNIDLQHKAIYQSLQLSKTSSDHDNVVQKLLEHQQNLTEKLRDCERAIGNLIQLRLTVWPTEEMLEEMFNELGIVSILASPSELEQYKRHLRQLRKAQTDEVTKLRTANSLAEDLMKGWELQLRHAGVRHRRAEREYEKLRQQCILLEEQLKTSILNNATCEDKCEKLKEISTRSAKEVHKLKAIFKEKRELQKVISSVTR